MKIKPPCPLPTKPETSNEIIVRMLNGPHPGHLVDPKAVLLALNNTNTQ